MAVERLNQAVESGHDDDGQIHGSKQAQYDLVPGFCTLAYPRAAFEHLRIFMPKVQRTDAMAACQQSDVKPAGYPV